MALVWMGYLIDLLVGDPSWVTHPVILIGKLISGLESVFYRKHRSAKVRKVCGVMTVLITVLLAYGITWAILGLLRLIHPWLAWIGGVWLLSTTIAQYSLAQASLPIKKCLVEGDLGQARLLTGQIVGRDTTNLSESEVVRATVETVAENTVDGVTAPLFYGLIGGAPLAMAYRAINTLDSMLGYRNQRYIDFGWAAARLDDLANFLPARLTGLLVPLACLVSYGDWREAINSMLKDAGKHPSPNSGILEAGFAGALGVRLGGANSYGGHRSFRAFMGPNYKALESQDIARAVWLMQRTSLLFIIVFSLISMLLGRVFGA